MLGSLFHRVRVSRLGWRGRLLGWWLKDNVGFLAAIVLPVLALGSLMSFAFRHQVHVETNRQRDIDLRCLAENIYFEARGEPLKGQFAVAEVTLNRVASPHFPDTVCDVVHDVRWDARRKRRVAHFSWTMLQLKLGWTPGGDAWQQAMAVATNVYDGRHTPVVPNALFFHATSVRPYWAKSKRRIARIGDHIFYR
jgi:N-acetylmuramoyl-L-alanine amidase